MNGGELISFLDAIDWRQPGWLLLACVPLLSRWLRRALQPRQARYADAHLLPWIVSRQSQGTWQRLWSKNSAWVLAWLLFGIAASGPRLALETVTQQQNTDMDIMLVVDTSTSMRATDIRPSRIRRAQLEIAELLERASDKRIGVIVFAARAHLFVPLTTDHAALRHYLRGLDSLTLPTRGSDAGAALGMALHELRDRHRPAAMVLLSDGDFDTIPKSTITALRQAAMPLFILGIGSAEGEAIRQHNGEWLHHEGSPVISRLDDSGLRRLATRANKTTAVDHYSAVFDDDRDWQQLYDEGIARLTSATADNGDPNKRWRQLYHWPLFIAVLLLCIALTPYGLPLSRRNKSATAGTQTTAAIAVVILLSLLPQHKAQAANAESQAYQHYADQDWPAAIAIYKQLDGYNARFGEGASHYRMADFNSAAQQFIEATLEADNNTERANALVNLGNSYFRLGDYSRAESAFNDALLYQPSLRRARHNLEFTHALKQAVDKRLRQAARAARMGSGPQLAPTRSAMDTQQSGALAIDEGESPAAKQLPLPDIADLSDATLELLIQQGLNHIQLAAQQSTAATQAAHKRDQLAYLAARLRMAELEDRQTLLWKRLFEMEEGFPAPLAEPRQVPEVKPW